jgi:hypothetical protein
MKIQFVPVFCRVGIKFVIHHTALKWLRNEVGVLLTIKEGFGLPQGADGEVVVYLDGDPAIGLPNVLGPVLRKRSGELELRIVVPLPHPLVEDHEEICKIVGIVLRTLAVELRNCSVDTMELEKRTDSILRRFSAREWQSSESG